jgi:hypothetical protein
MRTLDRVRRVKRTDQLIVPPLVRALVPAPHLVGDLQYLLQAFKPLGQ